MSGRHKLNLKKRWKGQKLFRPIGFPDCLVLSQLSQNTFNTVVVDQTGPAGSVFSMRGFLETISMGPDVSE